MGWHHSCFFTSISLFIKDVHLKICSMLYLYVLMYLLGEFHIPKQMRLSELWCLIGHAQGSQIFVGKYKFHTRPSSTTSRCYRLERFSNAQNLKKSLSVWNCRHFLLHHNLLTTVQINCFFYNLLWP